MRKVVSAGGLIFDQGRMLVVKHTDGFYGFVKGQVEPGESIEQAAIREVLEESGLHAEIIRYFGRVTRPSTQDSGEVVEKDIELFLMRIVGSADVVPEEETVWLPVDLALKSAWYPGELAFLRQHALTLVDIAADEDAVADKQ